MGDIRTEIELDIGTPDLVTQCIVDEHSQGTCGRYFCDDICVECMSRTALGSSILDPRDTQAGGLQ